MYVHTLNFILVGHFANVCPEAERLCYNCKQPGHLSAECNNPKVVEPKQCFNCGGGKIKREFDKLNLIKRAMCLF